MFLRVIFMCIVFCIFNQVNSTPTFGTKGSNSGGTSFIGDMFRKKAQFFDNLKGHFFGRTETGAETETETETDIGTSAGIGIGARAENRIRNVHGSGRADFHLNIGGSAQAGLVPSPEYAPVLQYTPALSSRYAPSSTSEPAVIGVTSNMVDLLSIINQQNYLDPNVVQSLSYVLDQPENLYQFVNEMGQIILVTKDLANVLVPNVSN